MTEILTLKEFLKAIRNAVQEGFPFQYQITAEIATFRVHNSGHCYIDLVEKKEETVVAKSSAVIWKGRFYHIRRKFKQVTGHELKAGLKVLLVAEVDFHELYGFKLNINDIDPSYTLGEFALHRKKIVERLEREGFLDRNKSLPFPLVPQRIAVISSQTAAGYEDFLNALQSNSFGYGAAITLFPAYMQGENTEKSILDALQDCAERLGNYDVVVIIRGGGDQVDLHSFDNYNIGKAVATFPLPILSGIGHRRDETVVDIVAHKSLISPTAVAEFIIDRIKHFEERIEEATLRIVKTAERLLASAKHSLDTAEKYLAIFTDFLLQNKIKAFAVMISNFRENLSKNIALKEFYLRQIPSVFSRIIHSYFKEQTNLIDRKRDLIEMMNPLRLMKKGYSITLHKGKIVKNVKEIKEKDRLTTRLYDGRIESVVEKRQESLRKKQGTDA